MNFGEAIEALKQGKKVTRKGWNGKGMFLWLKPETLIKEEWCKDELLKNLPPRARLDKIYLEEGMYDQLLNLVIQTPGLYILEEYYHDLLDYPEQLLNKYLEELKPLVGKQDITHYLKEIEEIPGGIQFISVNRLRK